MSERDGVTRKHVFQSLLFLVVSTVGMIIVLPPMLAAILFVLNPINFEVWFEWFHMWVCYWLPDTPRCIR